MDDTISRRAAIDELERGKDKTAKGAVGGFYNQIIDNDIEKLRRLPSAQPTLRERALMLLLNWAVECDFGYDNFPEEYERYKDEIEGMSYIDGMIYIAEKEVERND